MADVAGGAAEGCCTALCANVWWAFGLRNYGGNWTCCDRMCRCECCWDKGEFDPDNMPGDQPRQRETSQKKEHSGTERPANNGDEDLPAYKAADPMTVPVSAPPPAASVAQ